MSVETVLMDFQVRRQLPGRGVTGLGSQVTPCTEELVFVR
jgi:hypothetical protein